jgi:molecular chaperone GrpE
MTDENKEKTIEKEEKVEAKEATGDVAIEEVNETYQKKESNELMSVMKDNNNLLQEIKGLIQNRLEYDTVKEKAFDKLYEEMKEQKEQAALFDKAVEPLLRDLLLLYDNMKQFEFSLVNQQDLNKDKILQDFKYIVDDLIETLYRQDVTPMNEDLSTPFNAKFQKAIKTEFTDNMNEDNGIVKILRSGFKWRERILRPQEVMIKRFNYKR